MALNAAIVWEARTTGSNNNGGGFKAGASGNDYSQQDAAQLSFTDLQVKNAVYNRVYSVTHDASLTAAMIGNVIQVTGDGGSGLFTTGFYEVTAQGNDGDNYLDIDRNCASGNANDGIAALGGALADWWTHFNTFVIPGHHIYVKAGSYSLSGNVFLSDDGTAALPITIEGYNSSRGDAPTGNDRPFLQCGANTYEHDDYHFVKHMRFKIDMHPGIKFGIGCLVLNCKAEQTGTNALGGFIIAGNYVTFIDCEATAGTGTNNRAFSTDGALFGTTLWGCLAYNSNHGFYLYGSGFKVEFCVVHDCTLQGVYARGNRSLVANNTIYNCASGIYVYDAQQAVRVLNNIVSDCDVGIEQGVAEQKSNYFDFNNYYNNVADVSNVTKGPNATAYNPLFVRPAAQPRDFSLQDGSQCIGAGFATRLLGWSSSSSSSSLSSSSSSSTSFSSSSSSSSASSSLSTSSSSSSSSLSSSSSSSTSFSSSSSSSSASSSTSSSASSSSSSSSSSSASSLSAYAETLNQGPWNELEQGPWQQGP